MRAAYLVTVTLRQGGELAVANGWQARAARLLDELADDVVEHGYLCEAQLMGHVLDGDFPGGPAGIPGHRVRPPVRRA